MGGTHTCHGGCEKTQCGIVVDAQMLSMMMRKIQLCANHVLPDFTSDVQA